MCHHDALCPYQNAKTSLAIITGNRGKSRDIILVLITAKEGNENGVKARRKTKMNANEIFEEDLIKIIIKSDNNNAMMSW